MVGSDRIYKIENKYLDASPIARIVGGQLDFNTYIWSTQTGGTYSFSMTLNVEDLSSYLFQMNLEIAHSGEPTVGSDKEGDLIMFSISITGDNLVPGKKFPAGPFEPFHHVLNGQTTNAQIIAGTNLPIGIYTVTFDFSVPFKGSLVSITPDLVWMTGIYNEAMEDFTEDVTDVVLGTEPSQGTWKGFVGNKAYLFPSNAYDDGSINITLTQGTGFTFGDPSVKLSALQKPDPSSERIDAVFFSGLLTSYSIEFIDSFSGKVWVYCHDSDAVGRTQSIVYTDEESTVIYSDSMASFVSGVWHGIEVSAAPGETHNVVITKTGPGNAVSSGVFISG